ncbi:MAG: phosphoglycerate kinase [Chloroflexi bacterium RBG_16_68_14]|nr:MAG: phosphoglycerate kinase [Chloroflexi bacterium RBG_16_68_14]
MAKQTVRDIDVNGKRVLVRVDFNVPLDEEGAILDDLRIREALPTIQYLRERRAKVILCSHLGRPKGKVVESLRLAPIGRRLSELLLSGPVLVGPDCLDPLTEAAVARMRGGDLLLLENLRFHPEEEANDPEFARRLAAYADVFVNDAFGTAHRAHASTEGVTRYLPAVAGLLMEKEIAYLSRVVAQPERPLGAVIGGAKVSDKMGALRNLLSKADVLVIGGGMANTFLKAKGCSVGDSLAEDDQLDAATTIMKEAEERGVRLLLPVDVVVADRFAADARARTVAADQVPDGWRIIDVGPRSVAAYGEALQGCRTVVWNGPLGVAEFPQFARGSQSLARILADLDAVTIVGGGETAALVQEAGLADKFDHVSTGGGAFLEFLEGRELPGVAALRDKGLGASN